MNLNELITLANYVYEIYKKESKKNDYLGKPEFGIQANGESFRFDTIEDFKKTLMLNIVKKIQEITVSYYGRETRFNFSFHNWGWTTNLRVEIASNDRSKFLEVQDEIKQYFSNQTWNFIADKIIMALGIVLLMGLVLLFKSFLQKIDKALILLPIYLFLTLWIYEGRYFSSIYPSLVLSHNGKRSGRIFKKDVWLFIVLIVWSIIGDKLSIIFYKIWSLLKQL